MPLVETRELSVRTGRKTILDRIDFCVEAGEVVALVGPNGAGKSTLLRVLAGELAASHGQVLLNGRPIGSYSAGALAEHRAVLAQHTSVTFPFTVREIVSLGASRRRTRRWVEDAVPEAMARCDISHLADRTVTSLSGGEQQRVHLARTMLQLESSLLEGPKLLLLDEPTASLDIAHQLMVLDIIRSEAAPGTALVVVLHDLNLAAMSASRVVMMQGGGIRYSGAPAKVISNASIEGAFGVGNAVGVLPPPETPFVLPHGMKPLGQNPV